MKLKIHLFPKASSIVLLTSLLALLLAACGGAAAPSPTQVSALVDTLPPAATNTPPAPPTLTLPPTSTLTSTATITATPLPSSTSTITPTATNAPTSTLPPTPVPTYQKLRGEVTIAQAVCHYGPGKPYLYKYGVYQGSNLEIIARDPQGDYVEIQAIGGNNPCWVKAEYLKIKGDVMTLQPIDPRDWKLPPSPYYGPLTGVSAARSGDVVTVSWNPLILHAGHGDDSLQTPYVVEAWTCQGGQMVFTPVGSYPNVVKITDEAGCSEASHARVTAAEKHGYTRFVEVPWPPADGSATSTPKP